MKNEQEQKRRYRGLDIIAILLFVILIPLIPFILIIGGLYRVIRGTWLGFMVRRKWYPNGKYMLFVYSDSPNWKEYIETNILPSISQHAVIINWSDRSEWNWRRKPLELKVFQHWTGVSRYFLKGRKKWDGKEFNPVAITFIPWWKQKVFKFWQPFRDYKHSKDKSLKELEKELFEILKTLKQDHVLDNNEDGSIKISLRH